MTLKVSIAQLNLLVGDIEGNTELVLQQAVRARDEQAADLVLFPELTLTGYPPEDLLLRPELQRRVDLALRKLCAELRGVAVVIGYPCCQDGKRFNSAGVISEGAIVAEYHKALLPNYSVFDEKRYFEPGEDPCVFDLKGVHIGVTICEDIWYAAPSQKAREAGAELLLNLNASPFHIGKVPERESLLAKRAVENSIPIVYANLVGGQDELVFDGGSFVVDSQGAVTQRLSVFVEQLEPVELERDTDGRIQPIGGPITETASEESAVYQALVLGVRDYVTKNGFKGAVLGLSGGIDSALTLAVAVDALGAGQVEVLSMPSRYTAQMSNDDAREQADRMGVRYESIAIEPAFASFLEMLAPRFEGMPKDTTEENIQARCRGILLMALSNKTGRILLTTGNKSEMSVGYATLYGDMAGGFAPIKDVPKLLVYRLAKYRNSLSEVIPRRVIEREPSAELAPDQKDSDSLPPYEILDPILALYVEQDLSVDEIVARGYDVELVRRVARLVDRNEYKRRQAPPGVKITQRAFGRDRRYPLTSGF